MPFGCEFFIGACVFLHVAKFTYLREALTARFIAKGIPEPLFCETSIDTDSHAFLLYVHPESGESIGSDI